MTEIKSSKYLPLDISIESLHCILDNNIRKLFSLMKGREKDFFSLKFKDKVYKNLDSFSHIDNISYKKRVSTMYKEYGGNLLGFIVYKINESQFVLQQEKYSTDTLKKTELNFKNILELVALKFLKYIDDVDTLNSCKRNLIWYAVKGENQNLVEILISKGSDIRQMYGSGPDELLSIAIINFILHSDISFITFLKTHLPLDFEGRLIDFIYDILESVKTDCKNKYILIKFILDNGVNKTKETNRFFRIYIDEIIQIINRLAYSCLDNYEEEIDQQIKIIELFIKSGIDFNDPSSIQNSERPLLNEVAYLINNNYLKYIEGQKLFSLAYPKLIDDYPQYDIDDHHGLFKLLLLFLDNGADYDLQDSSGMTFIDYLKKDNPENYEYFLSLFSNNIITMNKLKINGDQASLFLTTISGETLVTELNELLKEQIIEKYEDKSIDIDVKQIKDFKFVSPVLENIKQNNNLEAIKSWKPFYTKFIFSLNFSIE